MTGPLQKKASASRFEWDNESRFVLNDMAGITVDHSEAEGEPFDMSWEATVRARAEDPDYDPEADEEEGEKS